MARGAIRKNAFLGADLFFVPPRTAKSDVELPFVQRLAQPLSFYHLRVDCRA